MGKIDWNDSIAKSLLFSSVSLIPVACVLAWWRSFLRVSGLLLCMYCVARPSTIDHAAKALGVSPALRRGRSSKGSSSSSCRQAMSWPGLHDMCFLWSTAPIRHQKGSGSCRCSALRCFRPLCEAGEKPFCLLPWLADVSPGPLGGFLA